MPTLQKQQDFRKVRKLPFCYLCRKAFLPGEKASDDHLPPNALFRKQDRDIPLILPTHGACNRGWHEDDELLGLLIAQIEGWPIPPRHRYLKAQAILEEDGRLITLSRNLNIHRFLVRCIRGFHSALYGQWLPNETGNVLHPPFRGGQLDSTTGRPTDHVQEALLSDELFDQHRTFVSELKKNRHANRTDRVVSRAGTCIYECVWTKLDNGVPICMCGLKIYNWHRFGELAGYTPRGCVGMYSPRAGRPPAGTTATELEFPFQNREQFNPFGE